MTHPPHGGSHAPDCGRTRRTGNNGGLLSDNSAANRLEILNNRRVRRSLIAMRHMRLFLFIWLISALAATAGAADCFADYKAKRDNPLRLHYGVMQITGPCAAAEARSEVAARLQRNGWTLLNVVSLFDSSGLEERRRSAGQYHLRF
jgi:hypothetical protein